MSLNVVTVAKMLGWSVPMLSEALKQGKCPFGVAVEPQHDCGQWSYRFFPQKVREYVGEEMFELYGKRGAAGC